MNRRELKFIILCMFFIGNVFSGFVFCEENNRDVRFYTLEKEYKKIETVNFHLNKAKAVELKLIVQNMLSMYGSVYSNEKDNTLYVTDTPDIMANLKIIIPKMDIDGVVAGGNLTSKLILLKNTDALDIIPLVSHKLSKDGKIFNESDVNGILVTDIESKIKEVESLIQDLDIPVKHIVIEVSIVELNNEDYSKTGFDLLEILEQTNISANYDLGNQYDNHNNMETRERSYVNKEIYESNDAFGHNSSDQKNKQDYKDYYKNNYKTDRDYSSYSIGANMNVNLGDVINLMVKDGKGKVLASPKIVTKNNKAAYINATEEIPFEHQIYSGEYTAETGIRVSVMPTIQQDSAINLRISPRIADLTGWTPKGLPIIFERTLDTEVTVKDGDTFVLGGLKKTEKVKSVKAVPILGKIPLIKFFFSKKIEVTMSREVVMFITPRIIKDNLTNFENEKKLLKTMEKL
jgi:type II secretory pathway component GspD/PulD (secretin)